MSGDVHVWRADAAQVWDALPLLSDAEIERSRRFYRESDRRLSAVARGSLRRILGRYLDVDPHSLEFGANEFGKPFLIGYSLPFNVAHSGTVVLIAVASDGLLGVDVEEIREEPSLVADCARYFTPNEQRLITGAREFFRLWTRKEACLKAIGTGLSTPLDAFDSSSSPVEGLHVHELDVEGDYAAAVATSISDARITMLR